MGRFGYRWLVAIVLAPAALAALSGCMQPAQTITKEDEARFRNPPKEPPAQYKGADQPPVPKPR